MRTACVALLLTAQSILCQAEVAQPSKATGFPIPSANWFTEINRKFPLAITLDELTVRVSPDPGSAVIGTLPANSRVVLLAEPRVTAKIASFNGSSSQVGYVESRGLRDRYPAIGRIGELATCTGTLIAPSVVLTASHCLFSYRDKVHHSGPTDIAFRIRGRLDERPQAFRIIKTLSLAVNRRQPSQGDIGIGLLERPVPAELARPLPFGAGPARTGEYVEVVGFGQCLDEHAYFGWHKFWHRYRIGSDAVATCSGDSGSPYISRGRVIGVHSSAYVYPQSQRRAQALIATLSPSALRRVEAVIDDEASAALERQSLLQSLEASAQTVRRVRPWVGQPIPSAGASILYTPAHPNLSRVNLSEDFEVLVLGESDDREYLWVQYALSDYIFDKEMGFLRSELIGDTAEFGWIRRFSRNGQPVLRPLPSTEPGSALKSRFNQALKFDQQQESGSAD